MSPKTATDKASEALLAREKKPVTARMHPDDYALYYQMAASEGISLSEWIEVACKERADRLLEAGWADDVKDTIRRWRHRSNGVSSDQGTKPATNRRAEGT